MNLNISWGSRRCWNRENKVKYFLVIWKKYKIEHIKRKCALIEIFIIYFVSNFPVAPLDGPNITPLLEEETYSPAVFIVHECKRGLCERTKYSSLAFSGIGRCAWVSVATYERDTKGLNFPNTTVFVGKWSEANRSISIKVYGRMVTLDND